MPVKASCGPSLFGGDLQKLFPVVEPDCSDSGNFDNALEFLLMAGRTLPEAVMMMIPEAWQQRRDMSPDKRAFYRVQLLPDGAVGRSGVHRLHRRQLHRRSPGPQWAAAEPVLRHRR